MRMGSQRAVIWCEERESSPSEETGGFRSYLNRLRCACRGVPVPYEVVLCSHLEQQEPQE